MKTEIRISGDGSHTLYVPELKEHFHSAFGAIKESKHVFIDRGLKPAALQNKQLQILEVGFGTGLNTLLTLLEKPDLKIEYTAIEAYPLGNPMIEKLNYPTILGHPNAAGWFEKIHLAEWEKFVQIANHFGLKKLHTKIEDVKFRGNQFNLVYFDAFAPDIQPGLWSTEIFGNIYRSIKPGGILVTYSSKGMVKQNLRSAGFIVTRLPGPKGKRHMVRGLKKTT